MNISSRMNLPIIGTGLNYIGLVILLLDMARTWNVRVIAMTDAMVIFKVIAVALMVIGTVVACLNKDAFSHCKVRKFLIVNSFAYAGIVSMIVYILEFPPLWRIISYVIVVIAAETILLRRKS